MKKLIFTILFSIMLSTAVQADEINVVLDGREVEFNNQTPVIVEGKTFVPLRDVFENLGYYVKWDEETKTAMLCQELLFVYVTENKDSVRINNREIQLEVPAQIIDGSMMIPVRELGENLGLEVSWDSQNNTVYLESNGIYDEAIRLKAEEEERKESMETSLN